MIEQVQDFLEVEEMYDYDDSNFQYSINDQNSIVMNSFDNKSTTFSFKTSDLENNLNATKNDNILCQNQQAKQFQIVEHEQSQAQKKKYKVQTEKFQPIIDDKVQYNYEDNPELYRKIRKKIQNRQSQAKNRKTKQSVLNSQTSQIQQLQQQNHQLVVKNAELMNENEKLRSEIKQIKSQFNQQVQYYLVSKDNLLPVTSNMESDRTNNNDGHVVRISNEQNSKLNKGNLFMILGVVLIMFEGQDNIQNSKQGFQYLNYQDQKGYWRLKEIGIYMIIGCVLYSLTKYVTCKYKILNKLKMQ